MKWEKDTDTIPIKSWCESPEDSAMEQAYNLAKLSVAFHHIALMPDMHLGYGMPIGGVMAVKDAVIPNAVGVDIGCGMIASKTNIKEIDKETLKTIMSDIRKVVPVGVGSRRQQTEMWGGFDRAPDIQIIQEQVDSARPQLGTLGAGNHFIEIQKGDDGFIWIMIHSGSRNLGYKTANHFHKVAIRYCEDNKIELPTKELAYLRGGTHEFNDYMSSMNFCLDFARANRTIMMENVEDMVMKNITDAMSFDRINIHHNYAHAEEHFGELVFVHRKGATSATKGQYGIIPGSQGTASYIVNGKGNPESFESCSHGAGRKMGRGQARRTLNFDAEVKMLNDRGIIHSIRTPKELDEAAGAYKGIEEVMESQSDLVEIVTRLTPLCCIKG